MRKTAIFLILLFGFIVSMQLAWWSLKAELYFCTDSLSWLHVWETLQHWIEYPPEDFFAAIKQEIGKICAAEDVLTRPPGR